MDGVPFNELMRQAASLKSHHDSVLRKRYDSWGPWYQNSIFATDDVLHARNSSFDIAYKAAVNIKSEGNTFFNNGSYFEAVSRYECALSIFKWVHPLDDDWKKKVYDFSTIILYFTYIEIL